MSTLTGRLLQLQTLADPQFQEPGHPKEATQCGGQTELSWIQEPALPVPSCVTSSK